MKHRATIVLYLAIAALVLTALYINLLAVPAAERKPEPKPEPEEIACTADAKLCPDGSGVGRSGPECTFAACPSVAVGDDVQSAIEEQSDLITIATPEPGNYIASPLRIAGEARGTWFFEASAPVVLTDWDGQIIAESYITADGDWMTEDKVSFTGTIEFESPYAEDMESFMQRGTLILQKANPSDLPENDAALELPVAFVPAASDSEE